MTNFVGEYPRQLDERGRVILPAKIRDAVGGVIYITRAPSEKCLYIYTEDEWQRLSNKIMQLPTETDKKAAAFVRMFFGKADGASVDKQGRVPIDKKLVEYAGLSKDVILIGANTRLELWDVGTWDDYQDSIADDLIVEGIQKFGLGI